MRMQILFRFFSLVGYYFGSSGFLGFHVIFMISASISTKKPAEVLWFGVFVK